MSVDLPVALAEARSMIADAERIAVLTGAGMSAESGIPTFREARTGLWERFSPEELATEDALFRDPELVWSWLRWMGRLSRASTPNAGHEAIGLLQQQRRASNGAVEIVTQNIDDLHERGGAEVLGHLHGTLFTFRCAVCHVKAEYDLGTASEEELIPDPGLENLLRETPPACHHCANGFLRPEIVLFGELLPVDDFEASVTFIESADAVIVVGTSNIVQPAASLPFLALDQGAKVIEINSDSTPLTEYADLHVRATAATALPHIVPQPEGE